MIFEANELQYLKPHTIGRKGPTRSASARIQNDPLPSLALHSEIGMQSLRAR